MRSRLDLLSTHAVQAPHRAPRRDHRPHPGEDRLRQGVCLHSRWAGDVAPVNGKLTHGAAEGGHAAQPGKGRVLVLDDEQSTCELLEVMLRRQGLEVEWRTSAHD